MGPSAMGPGGYSVSFMPYRAGGAMPSMAPPMGPSAMNPSAMGPGGLYGSTASLRTAGGGSFSGEGSEADVQSTHSMNSDEASSP